MNDDRLQDVLRDALQHNVSQAEHCLQGLEDRITRELDGELPRPGLVGRLRQLIAPTRGARWGQLAVLTATAIVFLVIGASVVNRLPGVSPTPSRGTSQAVGSATQVGSNGALFIMPAPDASNVTVVGNFTDWEAVPLSDEDEDGIWMASIPLSPGRYEYAFVVDGKWWGQDPLADEYVHSFGEYNSVRYIGRAGDEA